MDNIEKMIRDFIGDRVYYNTWGGGYIWGEKNNETQMIAQVDGPEDDYVLSVRGWGAIQNLIKNQGDAEKFQDALGEWIVDAINQKLNKP